MIHAFDAERFFAHLHNAFKEIDEKFMAEKSRIFDAQSGAWRDRSKYQIMAFLSSPAWFAFLRVREMIRTRNAKTGVVAVIHS